MEAIYSVILEKILFYRCEVFYRNTTRQYQELVQIQRSCILLVTKAYMMVSSESLLVLTGVLPVEYSTRIGQAPYLRKKGVSDVDLFGQSFSRCNTYCMVKPYSFICIAFVKLPPTGRGWKILWESSKIYFSRSGSRVGKVFVDTRASIVFATRLCYFGVYRLANRNSVLDFFLQTLF